MTLQQNFFEKFLKKIILAKKFLKKLFYQKNILRKIEENNLQKHFSEILKK